jgi:hypothetical protein
MQSIVFHRPSSSIPLSLSHTRPHPTPQRPRLFGLCCCARGDGNGTVWWRSRARTGVSPAYYRFFPFPAPAKLRQRAKKAAWTRSPPSATPPKPKTRPSQFHRKRCGSGCLGFAGRACSYQRERRFWSVLIRGDLLHSRFCLERQGTAVATMNGYSAWCGVIPISLGNATFGGFITGRAYCLPSNDLRSQARRPRYIQNVQKQAAFVIKSSTQ